MSEGLGAAYLLIGAMLVGGALLLFGTLAIMIRAALRRAARQAFCPQARNVAIGVSGAALVTGIIVASIVWTAQALDEGVPPGWATAFLWMTAAGVAVSLAGLATSLRAPRAGLIGAFAGVAFVVGAGVGMFVLPGLPGIGGWLAEVRCDRDPWCLTSGEAIRARTRRLDRGQGGGSSDDPRDER